MRDLLVLIGLIGISVLLAALKEVGLMNLSKEELTEIEVIKCPQCRSNLETVKAVCGLWRGVSKILAWGLLRMRNSMLPHVRIATKTDHDTTKSVTSHS
jgi:hypothetical protein